MNRLSNVILLLCLAYNVCLAESEITGKVVGIMDGDTIKIVTDSVQKKIRLYGIDCPEKNQAFGNKAKQFLSEIISGQNVKIIQEDVDRYGRIVGTVYFNNRCINEEIIKNGYAWVYRYYCKKSFCTNWIEIENQSKSNGIGLWSQKNPIPPWEFRHNFKEKKSNTENNATIQEFHGNISSHIFHRASCRYFNCKNCTTKFNSRDDAIKSGYRPCKICEP